MANNYLKHHLDNFDIDLMDLTELLEYNELRSCNSKRIALLELIKKDDLSYYLNELKECINDNDNKL